MTLSPCSNKLGYNYGSIKEKPFMDNMHKNDHYQSGRIKRVQARQSTSEVEEFSPSDLWDDRSSQKKRPSGKRIVLAAVLGAVGILFCVLFFYLRHLSANPSSLFQSQNPVTLELASPSPSPAMAAATAEVTPVPTPTPTLDPYSALEQQADKTIMHNIVNIMLIGVDYAQERETWSGKDGLSAAHADTMIVLAVNFDKNTADLISLPRDTYAKIPGVDGIYKLNASLDCGGGLRASGDAGFRKVCEAASRMIGGIPINYYYAVTMPSVKKLVDAIGGVDYDLEVSFKIQGRSYKKGQQHMDGQAVLDYLRVRKSGSGLSSSETGDSNRVDRQKKMLVAIFDKLKSANMLTTVPQLLESMTSDNDSMFYTNCSTAQTAALALYAYNMPTGNISMRSMSGPMKNLYSWNFCFPKPSVREQIIEEVYGITVSDLRDCTLEYATYHYQETVAVQYLETCEKLTSFLKRNVDPDTLLYEDSSGSYHDSDSGAAPVVPVYLDDGPGEGEDASDESDAPAYDSPGATIPSVSSAYYTYTDYMTAYQELSDLLNEAQKRAVKYLNGDAKNMSDYASSISGLCETLSACAERAAFAFDYTGSLNWDIVPLAEANEIYVDFR